jgi:serine/threonine-protein phosphatase 6 regulatory ankyrin repeat subunit B
MDGEAKEKVRLLLNAIEARETSPDLLESPTTLLLAAISAQHDLAYRLLAQGADVTQRKRDNEWTALMEAAQQEQDGLFDLVLQKSLNINSTNAWGRTALSFAAEHGSENKVRSLLKRNASDYARFRDMTPLIYAARNDHLQVVLLLLRQTKGVDLSDDSLRSAVTSAVTFGDAQFLELIYEKGKLDQPDWRYGNTVLHGAARRGDLAVVKWLLNQSVGVDAPGYDRRTPLMLAVYGCNDAVVEHLLQHGARIDAQDVYHATALHWALSHRTDRSLEYPEFVGVESGLIVNSNIVKMLVEAGADLEAKNAMDETPLTRAAINGSESAVRMLLEKGANVESRDKSGFVPVLLAAWKGHTAVVRLLLEYGASSDSADADGNTALMLAAHNGHHKTVLSLLARSAEINRVNRAHRTALSFAAEKGHDKAVELLLRYGAEVDLTDNTGRTPLLWAVQNEHERCVELLVQGGADITRGDPEGRTPLWWASSRDRRSSGRVMMRLFEHSMTAIPLRAPEDNMTENLHRIDKANTEVRIMHTKTETVD